MESKYYTPKKEELHIGFECEMRFFTYENGEKVVFWKTIQINKEWFTDVIGIEKTGYSGGINLDSLIEGGGIRVKYLDREDIESDGFKFFKTGDFGQPSFFKKEKDSGDERMGHTDWTMLQVHFWTNSSPTVEIVTGRSGHESGVEGFEYVAFKGTIKNKSEFRRIMEQLGIR